MQASTRLNNAFNFTTDFDAKLDSELNKVIQDFNNRRGATREEIEKQKNFQKEVDREQKILKKVEETEAKLNLNDIDDNRSSISVQQKLRQSLVSEVEIDLKQTAIKKVLEKQDFTTYKRIERGEMDSDLEDIVFSEKDINKPSKKPRNILESSFEDLPSDDESVFNVYWEEFEKRELRRRERDIEMLHNPMVLLEKLEVYSKNLYRNLSTDDKNELMRQIENFLDEGVTPLQKYYDELKSQFTVPSKDLLKFEKKEFQKQLSMIRKAQKKEMDQVKYMASVKAKKIVEELVEVANVTVKKEMTNIVKQYDQMSRDLYYKQKEIEMKDKMLRTQEKTIIDLRLSLFQSVTRQSMNKDEIEKFEKYLNSNLSKDQNDINQMIKVFMKRENPLEEIVSSEPFMKNPFSFYSSYISLSLRDREAVVREDLLKYYLAQIEELKHRIKIKDKEIKASTEMNNYYVVQLNTMANLVDNLRTEVSELNKDIEYDKNRYEKLISDMNKDFMQEKMQSKKSADEGNSLLFAELHVREHIQLMLLKREQSLKDEIKTLKQILSVPRLHYKFIEQKNLDDLKAQHDKILERELKKIGNGPMVPKSTKNTYRSSPAHKRSGSSIKPVQRFSNFGFGERNRKLSEFMHNIGQKSPGNSDSDTLPHILNKTTDSTLTTLRSFRYDRSSPMLDMTTIMSTSNNEYNSIIDYKRNRGNASQIQILKGDLQ